MSPGCPTGRPPCPQARRPRAGAMPGRAGAMPGRACERCPRRAATMERMLSTADYRKLSFWLDTVPGTLAPDNRLAGDVEVDVAIAGAGYTGLWTAYYLARTEPGLRIAVCEREIAGFGASGRNGGWGCGPVPPPPRQVGREGGPRAGARRP